MTCLEQAYDLQSAAACFEFEFPSFWGELEMKEVCMSMTSICNRFAEDLPKAASGWPRGRYLCYALIVIELIRYFWHRIRLVALNFRRHTPPSTSYTLAMSFAEHAAFVEEIICDREDLAHCIEGLFMHRRNLHTITRDMLEDAIQAHLAMEVRRWYPKKHRLAAEQIIDRIERTLGVSFQHTDKTRESLRVQLAGIRERLLEKERKRTSGCSSRGYYATEEQLLLGDQNIPETLLPTAASSSRERLRGGASITQPIPYDAHPDDSRKPYLYIGEQRLHSYFKFLPTQCVIWGAKILKSCLLSQWGFKWHNYGPVQVWVRHPPEQDDGSHLKPPLLFCPGLFLGNTAYLHWIRSGLMPLGKTRSLFLLEVPHLSHGIDPRNILYSLRYSWPSSDEISDAIANFLQECPGPVDVIGNSFGTVILTALRREHRHLFRKFVYVDPVCFSPCFPSPMLAVAAPCLDSYRTLLQEALRQSGTFPKLKYLIKFLLLRPAIFGDLEVQYVTKRGLYVHECTERGTLGPESLIIIGKEDELLHDPIGVGNWVAKKWPDANVQWMDLNHGAIMGHPRPFAKLIGDFLKDEP